MKMIQGAEFTELSGGLSVDFGDGRVAYVSDAEPDVGTDISIKDRSDAIGWLIYAHLLEKIPEHTIIWMMRDGGLFVAGRGITAEQVGL